jgi:hypothetical protein
LEEAVESAKTFAVAVAAVVVAAVVVAAAADDSKVAAGVVYHRRRRYHHHRFFPATIGRGSSPWLELDVDCDLHSSAKTEAKAAVFAAVFAPATSSSEAENSNNHRAVVAVAEDTAAAVEVGKPPLFLHQRYSHPLSPSLEPATASAFEFLSSSAHLQWIP